MTNLTVSIICFLIGTTSGTFFIWSLIKQNAIRKWASAHGKVLESRLNIVSGDSFEPYVKYSYTADGKNYTNDKISPVNYLTEEENAAKKVISPYWVDATVNVFYDPNDPSRSVLELKNSLGIHIFWAVFTAFFIVAGVIAWYQKA